MHVFLHTKPGVPAGSQIGSQKKNNHTGTGRAAEKKKNHTGNLVKKKIVDGRI